MNLQKITKVVVLIGLFIYFPLWLFTIHVHLVQVLSGMMALPILGSDSNEYWTLAQNLSNYHVYSLNPGITSEIFRIPGYPFFVYIIVTIFKSIFAVTLTQIILVLISAYLIYKIARNVLSENWSILCSVLFLFEPSIILHTLIILSDIPYLFLLVLSSYLILCTDFEYRDFLTGLVLGLSVLFRSISLFLPILYISYYIFIGWGDYKKYLKSTFMLILGFVIIITPWMFRNERVFNTYTLSTLTSYNMAYYNIPMFLSWKNNLPEDGVRSELFKKYGISQEDLRYPKSNASSTMIVKEGISDNLFLYAYFHLIKTKSFFFASSIKNTMLSYNLLYSNDMDFNFNSIFEKIVISLERLLWLSSLIILAIGVYFKESRKYLIMCTVMVLYFAVLTGPVSYARYRLPVEPYLFIGTVYSLVKIWRIKANFFKF